VRQDDPAGLLGMLEQERIDAGMDETATECDEEEAGYPAELVAVAAVDVVVVVVVDVVQIVAVDAAELVVVAVAPLSFV